MTYKQIQTKFKAGEKLTWNDPDPIKNNDYTISYIEELDDEELDEHFPLFIKYNKGNSEAQVFLHEIIQ